MYERSALGDIILKADFYDLNLDWNSARFVFWTSSDGSLENPNCEKTITYAYTTNCNPENSPCLAPGATSQLMNECGSANDCYVQESFKKRECTGVAAGSVTGYGAIFMCDRQGSCTLTQASTTLTVEQYNIEAACESYTLIGVEKEPVIYTTKEKGFVECTVWVSQISELQDLNFSILFEEKALSLVGQEYDSYMNQTYYIYRVEATIEMEALARANSLDGEAWEGYGAVIITHPVYGEEMAEVSLAIIFLGSREGGAAGEYTEENFNMLFDWVEGLAFGFMTDPIGTFTGRFFEVLVILVIIIILAPLVLYASYIAAMQRQQEQ